VDIENRRNAADWKVVFLSTCLNPTGALREGLSGEEVVYGID
jgi:hypothetical protein